MKTILAILLFSVTAFGQAPTQEERIAALEATVKAQAERLEIQAKEIAELRELVARLSPVARTVVTPRPQPTVAPTLVPAVTSTTSPAAQTQKPAASAEPVRIGGEVLAANCLSCPQPQYPSLAKTARVEGPVTLSVIVGEDGRVKTIRVNSGNTLLRDAALNTVKTWRYKPHILNGTPVEVSATVTVVFSQNRK